MENTLTGLLERRSREADPGRVHLPADGATITLPELLDRAQFLAGDFYDRGVRPGDVVGMVLQNGPDFLTTLLGLMYAGAVPAPLALPAALRGLDAYGRHLAAVVADSGMRFLVSGPEMRRIRSRFDDALAAVEFIDIGDLAAANSRLCVPVDPDALAFIQYTSGSTSSPKGVMLSQRNIATGLDAIRQASAMTHADTLAVWLPQFHDMGLVSSLVALAHCGELTLWPPAAFVRDPAKWLTEFAARGCTLSPAPNFSYDLLIEVADRFPPGSLDLSRWRLAYNGAEPVQAGTVRRFATAFAVHGFRAESMYPVYGMAEATLAVTFSPLDTAPRLRWVDRDALNDRRVVPAEPGAPGTRVLVGVGQPVPDMRVRVGEGTAADRVVDEIQISGGSVTGGYYRRPRAEHFTPDGWLRTGDLGFVDDGELFVVGRVKDMIIIRGQNIYPEDAEALVRDLPDVYRHRCAVVPRVTDEHEELVLVAETKLDDPARRDALGREIAAALRDGLGLADVVVRLAEPHSLPQTSSGKIQRGRVQAALAS